MNELQWIDYLKKQTKPAKDLLVGIGDDCALVRLGKEKFLLKSDIFIEGVHFKLGDISFKDLGKRALGRVFSDFAACGGYPKFIGVSAGIPAYIKEKDLKQILDGVLFMCKKYNASLAGGDTSRSGKLILDIWGIGQTPKCILRSTAKVGDHIFITGKLGIRKFNRPFEPRLNQAKELVKDFKINSMIDISDGFILDMHRILDSSKKGALLFKNNIPCCGGLSDLSRGEDYELIFTVDKNERKLSKLKNKYYFLGRIKPKSFGYKWESEDRLADIKVKGYTHF